MSRYRNLAICAALALAVLAGYWQVLGFGFVAFDDPGYVFSNDQVRRGLSFAGVRWAFTTTYEANWHPVTWLSHMLDCQLFGMAAGWHHATNLLLHIANTVVLFLVLVRMTGAAWRSAVVAALFAVHPLHVESVAWVAERKDVLSTLFGFLTILAYLSFVARPSVLRYLVVVALYVLGLLTKPMLVTLPCVLLLLDWWPLGRLKGGWSRRSLPPRAGPLREAGVAPGGRAAIGEAPGGLRATGDAGDLRQAERADPPPGFAPAERGYAQATPGVGRVLLEKVPLLVLAAASCTVTYLVQKAFGAMVFTDRLQPPLRVANALASYVWYMVKTVAPADLAVYYPYDARLPAWEVSGAAVLVVGATLAAVLAARRRPYVAVGWFWYLGTLVPVIGLVQVGGQAVADRYSYVPLVGVFIAIVWCAADLTAGWRLRGAVLGVAAGAAVLACIAITNHQVAYWSDGVKLFQHAIDVTGRNEVAQTNLAAELASRKQYGATIEHCREALRQYPDMGDVHNVLAVALDAIGQPGEAEKEFREAMRLHPAAAGYHINMGMFLAKQGRFSEARGHIEDGIRLKPDDLNAHIFLGEILNSLERPQAAAREFQAALGLSPLSARARGGLGVALQGQGRIEEAVAEFREAVRVDPREFKTLNNLAWILATSPEPKLRNAAESVELAERAARAMERKDPSRLDTLAAAYAEAGRFDDAVRTAEEALGLTAGGKQDDLAAALRARLDLYRAGKPHREERAAPASGAGPRPGAAGPRAGEPGEGRP